MHAAGKAKDLAWWEEYFAPGGGWEAFGGRRQTRLFAEAFTRNSDLDPDQAFSLLDVGCALGDAIVHFASVYPRAELYGIDFSATAIDRCRQLHRSARFSQADMLSLTGHYDIIYVSNVLEHFVDFRERARYLAGHCSRLCIMVPFLEMNGGEDLVPDVEAHHQQTFRLDSFDFFVNEGVVGKKSTCIFSCPGAWGWGPVKKMKMNLRNVLRTALGKERILEPRQILYDLRVKE